MTFGLYLHIPFCHARCGYCDFVTFTGKEDQIARYVEALVQELDLLARRHPQRLGDVSTVFLGGGTPSLLEPIQVKTLLDRVNHHWGLAKEITLEANPESVTADKACGWKAAGVNRLSLGLQSFDEALLEKMGRLHTGTQFRSAYAAVREAGFSNVNIDLIYGLPGQSLDSWKTTVEQAALLDPEHLSLYALAVEKHTPFAAAGVSVNDDEQAAMYEWASEALRRNGYERYEISNFCQAGRACEHNLIYWRAQDYLAAGVGAVGCVAGERWQGRKTLHDYFRSLSEGMLPWESVETLSPQTQRFERLMLGLRLREGFRWDDESDAKWLREREVLRQKGLLEVTSGGRWRVPDHAVALTNQVLLPFL